MDPWPDVTTSGLRNLAGVIHGNNVTLYATTSTTSTSGDNGADPNKVVEITDSLGATTMTNAKGRRPGRSMSPWSHVERSMRSATVRWSYRARPIASHASCSVVS